MPDQSIVIRMTISEAYVDPDHPMGLTEEGYGELSESLAEFGYDITIEKARTL